MNKLLISEIINATKGKFIKKEFNSIISNISIDSREINKNSLFIPIIGEVHNGHDFLEDAYKNGCRNFLIDKKHKFERSGINLIQVKNTTTAFGQIACYYKNKFDLLTVAITGSVGKTSTKDIIYSVLSQKYCTLKTEGNFNNNIGLPKTVLNLDASYDAAVFEMGMSKKGEIENLTNIVNPDIAIISNIGMSHIEFFKNQKGIFDAKMEITNNFDESNLLIVNGDDNFLKTLKDNNQKFKVLTYGFDKSNDVYCDSFEIKDSFINFNCFVNGKKEKFTIPSVVKHNIYNAMAAILVGLNSNMDLKQIKMGLKTFQITKGRMSFINKKEIKIIDDTYNASADSMISALSVLGSYNQKRIAILGDILETGKYAQQLHSAVGEHIVNNVDFLITVGENSIIINDVAIKNGFDKNKTKHFSNYEDLIKTVKDYIEKDDVILIKASHGICLDKVVEFLDDRYE